MNNRDITSPTDWIVLIFLYSSFLLLSIRSFLDDLLRVFHSSEGGALYWDLELGFLCSVTAPNAFDTSLVSIVENFVLLQALTPGEDLLHSVTSFLSKYGLKQTSPLWWFSGNLDALSVLSNTLLCIPSVGDLQFPILTLVLYLVNKSLLTIYCSVWSYFQFTTMDMEEGYTRPMLFGYTLLQYYVMKGGCIFLLFYLKVDYFCSDHQ